MAQPLTNRGTMSVLRRPTGRRGLAAATTAAVLLATGIAALAPAAPALADPVSDRQAQYTAAATEFGVPESILLGVSYLESRWLDHAGDPSTGAGFGPMHLTDATAVAAEDGTHHDEGTEDPRGDDSRPAPELAPMPDAPTEASLQTLDTAAALTGVDETTLRTDPAQNIRGGAALLAEHQRALNVDSDAPADWYGAVARYSGASDIGTAARFADDVFATIRTGASESTDGGEVNLSADPGLQPSAEQLEALGLRATKDGTRTDCPRSLGCEWIPAPYEQYGPAVGQYGNHDKADRPTDLDIQYIVIHDIEGYYHTAIDMVQDPTYVSWQYTMRSTDGHTAQHVKPEDVAWQAGNWYINSHSIGIEHEGFAANGAWYTETLYRTSARLVGYLADRYDIPLDRAHIIGHDNVPGISPAKIPGMHWDPGPYWDWSHYFDLLGAPFHSFGGKHSGMVTINPDFQSNRPAMIGCDSKQPALPCPDRPSSTVFLYSEPSFDAPLLYDVGMRPNGSRATRQVSDHGSRVSTGQRYAVADRQGDWLAIWYLGQKGWMFNPADNPVATPTIGLVVTPKHGRVNVLTHGRALPEEAAYEGTGATYQPLTPLPYVLNVGERYSLGDFSPQTEYYWAKTLEGPNIVVNGDTRYYQIQLGHRIMYVKADDVYVVPSFLGAP
ncbi:N-acetylmuramoyl-L-alanine amidase [Phytomonospora sp. NPDC050363]|uniref:N-acetylmuramoyl-L-alanine amidase n=1 Tax=Phytomonospora sp. NPDC050363 TaxID=3155642 RepID=UPI0033F909A7